MLWFRNCSLCGQGRLFIFKDVKANGLYLHCEECGSGWRDPDRAGEPEASFLALVEDFDAVPASAQDVAEHGWERYAVNRG